MEMRTITTNLAREQPKWPGTLGLVHPGIQNRVHWYDPKWRCLVKALSNQNAGREPQLLCPSTRHSRGQVLVSEGYCMRASHISVNPAYHASKWMKSWHLAWLSGIRWSQAISLRIGDSQERKSVVYRSRGTSGTIAWYWYRRSSLRLSCCTS